MEVHSLVKFNILLALSSEQLNGYDIGKQLEQRLARKMSPSQIYPFLHSLQKGGYITVASTGARKSKTFTLTPKGKKLTADVFSSFGGLLEKAFSAKLVKCRHCGCEVYKNAFVKRVEGKKESFCCIYCAKAYAGKNNKAEVRDGRK